MSIDLYVKLEVMVPLGDRDAAIELCGEAFDEAVTLSKPTPRTRIIKQCSAQFCNNAAKSRGMCNSHYAQWYKKQPLDANGKIIPKVLVRGMEDHSE